MTDTEKEEQDKKVKELLEREQQWSMSACGIW